MWRLTKKPKVSTSEFGHLSHVRQVDCPKVPKVSNVEAGHLTHGHFDHDFEERAAILEYDGGFSRTEAEEEARADKRDIAAGKLTSASGLGNGGIR